MVQSPRVTDSPWKWLLTRSDIRLCVERLAVDDRDICANVSLLKGIYPDIRFDAVSCRGRKIPPGGDKIISIDPTPIGTVTDKSFDHLDEATALGLEIVLDRKRSNSMPSRSSECQGLDDLHLAQLPKIRGAIEEDDGVAPVAADTLSDRSQVESEYTSGILLDPTVVDELDIIDGLKSPMQVRHKDAHSGDHDPFPASQPPAPLEE